MKINCQCLPPGGHTLSSNPISTDAHSDYINAVYMRLSSFVASAQGHIFCLQGEHRCFASLTLNTLRRFISNTIVIYHELAEHTSGRTQSRSPDRVTWG
ncbi:protein of unknown function [Cupriavidus taiwanensis]|nr:protein of unknown function [Cupriavidus taiwanensis]